MTEKWTTAIVAPSLEIAQSDDYIDPWPGDEVRIVAASAGLVALEGRRRERIAVREPEAFTERQLRAMRHIATSNAQRHPAGAPSAVFAVSTRIEPR